MDREVEVVVCLQDREVFAGRLWAHRRRGVESMTFSYDFDYLALPEAYAIDTFLPLRAGAHQTIQGRSIFGAFSDAAPDRWGRRIIERNETRRARHGAGTPRSFGEIDYLLGVRDDLRQGALRFREPGGSFLADDETGVPPLVELPRLLSAAEHLDIGNETDADLALLLRGGSSLGGARPKAHVTGNSGRPAIAKFPSPSSDEWDVMRWEGVALQLAREAGITVPDHELHEVDGRSVLVIERFDRSQSGRIGYMSALSMLGLHNGDRGVYLELAEVLQESSPHAVRDLHELWRRIAFSILISNFDDHLRNHGFLRSSTAGWSLAPAFDLNPDPRPRPRQLHTEIDYGQADANIEIVLGVAEYFRLDRDQALAIIRQVCAATIRWREIADAAGLEHELELMEPAFEHEAACTARALSG